MTHLFKTTLCIATLSVCFTATAATSTPQKFVAGVDYTVLASPGITDVNNKIEVREFFWYGCPHCFKLEPHIAAWKKTIAKDVNFIRTPAALNDLWEQNARGYFTAELLGVAEKAHEPLFTTIHSIDKARLFDQASLAKFYAAYGAPVDKFNSLFNSFAVSGKVAQSKNLAIKYQLEGVPALVVNGKYVVKGEDAKSLSVVNFLVNKERQLLPKSKVIQPTKSNSPAKPFAQKAA